MASVDVPIGYQLLTAGTAACIADFVTFPLDTAKVRLQIQGQALPSVSFGNGNAAALIRPISNQYNGLIGTIVTIARQEGPKSLFNGLSAGLQRQMCFASVRLGLYDTFKNIYQQLIDGNSKPGSLNIPARVAAGITTGGLAVLIAQPTDVVKVRFQAQGSFGNAKRYGSTLNAYRMIGREEGIAGLWRGTFPNVGRNAIVTVSEIVCYDLIKDLIINNNIMVDGIPCHFSSAVIAGLCTTVVASPVDVVKTRYMNSTKGQYKGVIDCAVQTLHEGPEAFYKGFTPSFCRLVGWNIMLWVTYEQLKNLVRWSYCSKELNSH